jgi:hypothetical protein
VVLSSFEKRFGCKRSARLGSKVSVVISHDHVSTRTSQDWTGAQIRSNDGER